LAETKIVSLEPPIAFSAQLALAGRLGDHEALASSRWAEVETLLSDHIVNRCDLLREGALRRKSRRIAGQLEAAADTRARAQDAEHEAQQRQMEIRHSLAARLRAERRAFTEKVIDALDEPLAQLMSDARPVEQLLAERQGDAEVRTYLVERTVERLTPAICRTIVSYLEMSGASKLDPSMLEAPVRATIGGAAAAYGAGPILKGAALHAAVEMAVVAATDLLATAVGVITVSATDRALQLRMGALRRALGASAQ
jgi:hypothetical protein